MIYHVKARLRGETAAALLAKLTDGSIEKQRPDGAEIVASMKRAVVNSDGEIEWSEMCFCNPPLAHERATVLDTYFSDITTRPIEAHESFSGRSFIDHLGSLASGDT